MKLGIVGLPNVGKSTLFNAITNAGAQSANFPFCTIEPNVGVVTVPDQRVTKLHEIYNSKRTIYADSLMIGPLRQAQVLSLCLIAGLAVIYWILMKHRTNTAHLTNAANLNDKTENKENE